MRQTDNLEIVGPNPTGTTNIKIIIGIININMNNWTICDNNFDEYLEKLKTSYHRMENDVEEMKQILQNWRKDKELQELREEIRQLHKNTLLIMTDKEKKEQRAFCDKHYESCKNGGSYTYHLCGTGIGTSIKIECDKCHEIKDITDVDSW